VLFVRGGRDGDTSDVGSRSGASEDKVRSGLVLVQGPELLSSPQRCVSGGAKRLICGKVSGGRRVLAQARRLQGASAGRDGVEPCRQESIWNAASSRAASVTRLRSRAHVSRYQ